MAQAIQKQKEREKGLASLAINLKWEGSALTFSSLSRGGLISIDYVSQSRLLGICFFLTMLTFLIAVYFRKSSLRIRLTYIIFGAIIFYFAPAVFGAENTVYCNAATFGIIAGAIFYAIHSLAAFYKRALPAALILLALCFVFALPDSLYAGEENEQPQTVHEAVEREKQIIRGNPQIIEVEPESDNVIIPYDPKDVKNAVGKGKVYITSAKYEELLRAAGLLPQEQPLPSQLFCVNSAVYTARILADRADFTLEMKVELLRPESARVYIGLSQIALRNSKLNGETAKLESAPTGYFLVLTEPDLYTFTTEFSLPVDSKKVSGTFNFPIRPVPASVLKIKSDNPNTKILVHALGGQEVVEAEESSEVIAALGPIDSISISYGPKESVATGASIATDAQIRHYYWLSENLINALCMSQLTVSGGEKESFWFVIPDNLDVYRVTASKEIRAWSIERGSGGERLLQIVLYEPVKGGIEVTINALQILEKKTGGFSLPFIHANDARKEAGSVAVFLANRFKATVVSKKNLNQVHSEAKTSADYKIYSAYEYTMRPIEISFTTIEKEPDIRTNIFSQLSILKDRLLFNTKISATVAEKAIFDLTFFVPSEYEIDEISCLQMTSKFVKEEGGKRAITLYFEKPLLDTVSVSVSGSRMLKEDETELNLPQVTVPAAKFSEGYISVSSVEGIALTTKDTQNLTPVDIRLVPVPKDIGQLAGEKRLAFSFRKQEHKGSVGVDKLKPVLNAAVISSVLVNDEVVSFTTVIEYQIKVAACRKFAFSMPYQLAQKAVLITPFERQKSLTKEGEGADAVGVWTVELQRDVMNSYTIAVNWEETRQGEKLFTIPTIKPRNVETSRIYLIVQNSSGLKVTENTVNNLETVSKEDIPLLNAVLVPRATLLFSYRVQEMEKDYSHSFSLTKLEEEKEIEAIIDIAEITTIISSDGSSFNEASFKIQNRAKQYLQLELPQGAELWSAEVAGKQVKPALPPGSTGTGILIPLLKQSKGELSYNIKILYGLKLESRPGFSASLSPKAPKPVDITVGQTFWTIYAPQEFEYDSDGNMDEVIGSVVEVEKAFSYAQETEQLMQELKSTSDLKQREQIYSNIEKLNEKLQEQYEYAQKKQSMVSQADKKEFAEQQYDTNVKRLQEVQKQITKASSDLRTEAKQRQTQQIQQPALQEMVVPQLEQTDVANKYLEQTQERVREQIAKEDEMRREITAFDKLSNKKTLDSRTLYGDAYGVGGGRAGAYSSRWGKGSLTFEGGCPGTESAVTAGLGWPYFHQDKDGHWDQDGFSKNCDPKKGAICGRPVNTIYNQFDVGVTGLMLLAYLGHGHTHRVGEFKKNVRTGLDWLSAQQDSSGCFAGDRSTQGWIFNHAIATWAICEAYAVSRDPRLKDKAQKAVDYIVRTQNRRNGGWGLEPGSHTSNTAVTSVMVLALKSAITGKLNVPYYVFTDALVWFDSVTDQRTGRVGYTNTGDDLPYLRGVNDYFVSQPTLTAMATISRIFCGQSRNHPMIQKGVDIMMRNLPNNQNADFLYYYFGTYAMFQYGGDEWARWNEAMRQAVVTTQRVGGCADGSWDPVDRWGVILGRVYSTAINCLTLEVYYRYARSNIGAKDSRRGTYIPGDHGARAAGFMPPRIQLPKSGKVISFKKLGTDPVLVLKTKDINAYDKMYAFITLVSLLIILFISFMLRLSFFGEKDLTQQIKESVLIFLSGFLCALTVWLAVITGCAFIVLLILAKSGKVNIISAK
ncbi:MAG: hypothetical protein ABIH42_09830 [Planctomycetota bacterium]